MKQLLSVAVVSIVASITATTAALAVTSATASTAPSSQGRQLGAISKRLQNIEKQTKELRGEVFSDGLYTTNENSFRSILKDIQKEALFTAGCVYKLSWSTSGIGCTR